jgi:hypothetical protein
MKTILSTFFAILALAYVSLANIPDERKVTFSILGYLDEYMSRFDIDGNPYPWIERFSTGQKEEADRFEKSLRHYYEIKGKPYSAERKVGVGETRSFIYFIDDWMTSELTKYYSKPDPSKWYVSLDRDYILSGSKDDLKAFLKSAWDRHGNDRDKLNLMYLSNAPYLSETIAMALREYGSEWVVIYIMPNNIPVPDAIRFDVPETFALEVNEVSNSYLHDYWTEWRRYGTNGPPIMPVKKDVDESLTFKTNLPPLDTNNLSLLPVELSFDQPYP